MSIEITISPTDRIVELEDGIPARIWEGTTPSGAKVYVFVMAVGLESNAPEQEEFERELLTVPMPEKMDS